jgi:uncharacterized YccA/Bax inhibitor family protein
MQTSNPILNTKLFNPQSDAAESSVMTIEGTVNIIGILLLLLVFSASLIWKLSYSNPSLVTALGFVGLIGGLIMALITIFKKEISAITVPIYAVCEGLFLGGISAFLEAQYPGLFIQAVSLTFGTLFGLLFAYKSRLIKVTEKFTMGIASATMGIALFYGVSFILSLFGVAPFFAQNSLISIGFSLFVVVIAALNLVLDFNFIENAAASSMPKYMEWFAAFGLLVTLVWLYLEILRLLAKLRSRD